MSGELSLTENEQLELETCERVIDRHLQEFFAVGTALLSIRDQHLYRSQYPTFDTYCEERWGFSDERARQFMRSAEVVENLKRTPTIVGVLPGNEAQARPLTQIEPERQPEVWQKALDTAPNGRITAAHVQKVVDESMGSAERRRTAATQAGKIVHKPHVAQHSGNNEWNTPPEYIEAARRTMGSIDLDPASSAIANQIVKADHFYTLDDDGLAQDWFDNVWHNPPYGQPDIRNFARKVVQEIQAGHIAQICILVNNATETGWFHLLLGIADAFCLLEKRIKFLDMTLEPARSPLQGQVVLYAGPNLEAFTTCFAPFGEVCYPAKTEPARIQDRP